MRTSSGSWLLLYGTRLAGGADDRTAVIIQPATPAAVAPLVTLAYGLSERESQVTRLCMQGVSTRQMAHVLALSPHTVQDHLKSIFAKTGVRSRSELVGQIFLEHYVPRWEDMADVPTGWLGKASPVPVGIDPGPSSRYRDPGLRPNSLSHARRRERGRPRELTELGTALVDRGTLCRAASVRRRVGLWRWSRS